MQTDTPRAPEPERTRRPLSAPAATLRRSPRWYGAWGLVWLVFLVVGVTFPHWMSDDYYLRILVRGASLGILALSIGWLLRQTGLLSFGHAGFYAVGAYVPGIVIAHWGVSTVEAALLGIVAAAVLGFLTGVVIIRTSGITFAMLTLAVGQIVYVAITNTRSLTGGYDGMIVNFPGNLLGVPAVDYALPATGWTLVWCCALVALAVLWWVSRTVYGRRLTAIRENEERVRFLGRQTLLPRVGALTISAGVAGLAGVLHALTAGLVTAEDAAWTTSGLALVVAVIGGVGSLAGPVGAGMAFILLESALSSTSHFQLVTGLVLIAVVLAAPGGIAGLVERAAHSVRRRVSGGGNAA